MGKPEGVLHVRYRYRCEDNIEVDLEQWDRKLWTGSMWLKVGTNSGLFLEAVTNIGVLLICRDAESGFRPPRKNGVPKNLLNEIGNTESQLQTNLSLV